MDGVRRWRDSGGETSELEGKRARLEAVAEYAESLRELTFSSKPIINSLTMIADENRLNAPQIAEAINIRILQVCAPTHRHRSARLTTCCASSCPRTAACR